MILRAPKLIAVTAVAALGLAACSNNGHGAGAAGICKPFTTATANPAAPNPAQPATNILPAAPAGDPSAGLDDCLHRWGYTLAASSDPANFVADATLAACSQALAAWNQQSLTTAGQNDAVQAPSLMNGQATNPLAEHYGFAQGRALFYVVQARAGHCSPPPASSTNPNTRGS